MQIDEQHIAEPVLAVVDITAADEGTIRTVMDGLQQQWATSGIAPVWRTPGEAGVRARVYADIRRPSTLGRKRAAGLRGGVVGVGDLRGSEPAPRERSESQQLGESDALRHQLTRRGPESGWAARAKQHGPS